MANLTRSDGASVAEAAEVWADGLGKRIVTASRRFDDPRPEWDAVSAEAESTRRRLLRALFIAYDELGMPEGIEAGATLGRLVADAVELAHELGWTPERRPIPPRVRTLVYRRDGYACLECGCDDVTRLVLDHRVPVSRGGDDEPENLRTLCRPCNERKGARL